MIHKLGPEINYLELIGFLKDYRNPRDRITKLLKNKDLIRVKKGIYVLGPKYEKPYSLFLLSNIIYGPSYVSSKSALSYYGAIPEKVSVVTCRSISKSKRFSTPVGNFHYKSIPLNHYGISLRRTKASTDERYFFMASPEKSLLEEIHLEPLIKTMTDLHDWIFSYRIDEDFLNSLNINELELVQSRFHCKRINLFVEFFKDRK